MRLRSSSARLSSRRARLDQRLELLAGLVGGLADRRALRRLQLGHAAQQLRQLGLAPEVAHPQLLQRLAGGRAVDLGPGLRAQLLDPLDHDARTLDDRAPDASPSRTAPRSRPSRRSATPPRSGCARRARTPHDLRSASPSRSDPTSSVTTTADRREPAAQRGQRLAGAGDERDALARQRARRRSTRASPPRRPPPCSPAPPWASTGPRSRGPSATHDGAERLRAAQHRAHVARDRRPRADTRTAGPRARPPALLVHADHARARAERRDRRERRRLDVVEAPLRRAACPPAGSPPRAPTRRPRRPRSDPRPRRRTCRLRSRSRLVCRRRSAFRRGLCGEMCHLGDRS